MDIRIKVEGRLLETGSICCPPMSLHEPRARGLLGAEFTAKPFEIRIKANDLVEVMNEPYSKFVKEIKEDDENCGEPVAELAASGYPGSIGELLGHPAALDVVFGRYLMTEFLGTIPSQDVREPRHLYLTPSGGNNVCHCFSDGDDVVFTGMCT